MQTCRNFTQNKFVHLLLLAAMSTVVYLLHDVTIHRLDFGTMEGPLARMDDPRVVEWLKMGFLFSPSQLPYNLSNSETVDTSMGQAEVVNKVLKWQKNGFFIECGALDGETRSNTLFFERQLGWSGLLIEADPLNFKSLMSKHRHVYTSNTCLSVEPYPTKVSFHQGFNRGKISDIFQAGRRRIKHIDVQCFPLYTFLLALGRTTVDYFSLDIEGHELRVLKTVPFDRVDIRVLSVEFLHDKEGRMAIKEFMESKGYYVYDTVIKSENLANDFIFVKKDIPSSRDPYRIP